MATDTTPELEKLLEKCEKIHQEKKFKEIISILPNSVLTKYNNSSLYWYCAYALNKLSQQEKALEYYTKSINSNKKHKAAYNNRGVIYKTTGENQKAIEDYTSVIELDKDYALAYRNRGVCYADAEKYKLAIDDFEKALVLDYETYSFLEANLEQAKENLLLQGISKNKKEIKELSTKMENNVQAILEETREDRVKHVAHYTKLGVVKGVVEKSIEVKHEEKNAEDATKKKQENKAAETEKQMNGLWYFNVIYMNDPEEGEILFKHFFKNDNIKECFENGKRANETSVYLGCFLSADEVNSHEDDLVMWRTYGKDEKKNEAAGCSLVISTDFFDKEADNAKYRKMELSLASNSSKEFVEMKQPQNLLKVIYLNKNKKGLPKKIKEKLSGLQENLTELITLREVKNRKEGEKKLIDKIIFEKLSKICYLFKSADYAFENEIRVIEYVPLGSRKIKKFKLPALENSTTPNEQAPARLYIESNKDILPYTEKIYLGAKVPSHDHWSTYLDYEIRQREREREKRDANDPSARKIKVEVIKSTCNFQ